METTFLGKWCPKVPVLTVVLVVHAVILTGALRPQSRSVASDVEVDALATQAQIVAENRRWDRVPAPDVQLKSVPLEFAGLLKINFDDSVQEELAEVTGPFSAPHLARVQSADPRTFAQRAHLPPRSTVTILLRVEVREDGSVGSADIVRTSGNTAADAAAIAYAQDLRWVPGTNNRIPKTMRVNFQVTLVSPSTV
jgi:TonB family protein